MNFIGARVIREGNSSDLNTKYGKGGTPCFCCHHKQPCKSSIKGKNPKRSQSSTIISTRQVQFSLVQYHHLYTASSAQSTPVSLSLRYEFSPASSDFTATQTNSYSTLSSTTLESEGESPSKILSKLESRID